MLDIIMEMTRANEEDNHRHYSITGVCPFTSHEVCARHTVLPTGPSGHQVAVNDITWNLWAVKRPEQKCLVPSHLASAVGALTLYLAGHDPALIEVLDVMDG